MLVDIKTTPYNKSQFKEDPVPFKTKGIPAYFVMLAITDCSTHSVRYGDVRFYNSKGVLIGKTDKYRPTFSDLNTLETNLNSVFCRQSSDEKSDRWADVGGRGEKFEQARIYIDLESLPERKYGMVEFWWKIVPKFPVAFALSDDIFNTVADTLIYTKTVTHSIALCPNRQLGDDETLLYDKTSKLMERESHNPDYKNIIPGSIGERLFKYVCSDQPRP